MRVTLRAAAGEICLAEVGGVNHRFGSQQGDGGEHGGLLRGTFDGAGGLALLQNGINPLEEIQLGLQPLIPLEGFGRPIDPPLQHLHVGEDELQVDGLDIPQGVDAALHVHNVFVFEAAHHVDDGVHLADVGKEFVAQALAFAGPLDQAGNVHEFDDRRRGFGGVVHPRQLVQPYVRHRNHADIGVDGAEGIVGALGARVGDGVKQSGFAHVGQSDNTEFQEG